MAPRGAGEAARRHRAVPILGLLVCHPHQEAAGLLPGAGLLREVRPGHVGRSALGACLLGGLRPAHSSHDFTLSCRQREPVFPWEREADAACRVRRRGGAEQNTSRARPPSPAPSCPPISRLRLRKVGGASKKYPPLVAVLQCSLSGPDHAPLRWALHQPHAQAPGKARGRRHPAQVLAPHTNLAALQEEGSSPAAPRPVCSTCTQVGTNTTWTWHWPSQRLVSLGPQGREGTASIYLWGGAGSFPPGRWAASP